MAILRVAGLDPSMKNFGMVKGNLDLDTGVFTDVQFKLQETSSDNKNKKTVRKNSDDLNRARLLYISMNDFLMDADMVFVEIPVGSQSARAMASYGMCIGVLGSIDQALIQVTPAEVKMAATGNKHASKVEMIEWATKLYPEASWLTEKRKGVLRFLNKNEHLADAIGAIHAGVRTDEFKQARSILIKG